MITLNHKVIAVQHFQDNTQKLNIPEVIVGPCVIEWKYESDEELITLIYVCGYLKDNYPENKRYLTMLYVPNGRMDRTEEFGDVFTLKYFCNIINSLNFEQVTVLDTHSKVTDALLDRLNKVSVERYLVKVLQRIHDEFFEDAYNDLSIVFPDRGAFDRYSTLECLKPFKKIIGNKSRDWNTGTLQGQELIGLDKLQIGHPVLIIDDILSTGGTICKTISNIREANTCPIYLYVSHLENASLIKNTDNWQYINTSVRRIYTTDGLYNQHQDKIIVL